MQEKKNHTLAYGFLFGLLIGTVALGGVFVGWSLNQSQSTLELPIQATASSTSDTMAIATGPIGDGTEGLYTLDFLTGDLQCAVLSSRSPRFGAVFRKNCHIFTGKNASAGARRAAPLYKATGFATEILKSGAWPQ